MRETTKNIDLEVVFDYGTVISRDEMRKKTIYLDGVVRGPVVDNAKQSYSFDHHGDCVRMATLATCQQVLVALELGLDPSGFTVVLNDLDADASLGLWLLLHPARATDERVREMVTRVGFIDSHGPVYQPSHLHQALTHRSVDEQSLDMLWKDQDLIDAWYEQGDEGLPGPEPRVRAPAFGVNSDGELLRFEQVTGFAELYDAGAVAAVVCPSALGDTIGYIVAKRSDFVRYDVERFLESMSQLEDGWGGSNTVGGAPRREGGLRSSLPIEQVCEIFVEVATKSRRFTEKSET